MMFFCQIFEGLPNLLFTSLFINIQNRIIIFTKLTREQISRQFDKTPNHNIIIEIIINTMASRQPIKLIDVTNKLKVWGIRLHKFFKHRILSKRKNVLIIGDDSQLRQKTISQFSKTWQITTIQQTPISKLPFSSESTSTKLKSTPIQNWILTNNQQQLEQQFKERQFDSIIVMPESMQSKQLLYDVKNQYFCTDYVTDHNRILAKNLFAYRLAHRFLTTSGVVILNCSESDFVALTQRQKVQEKNEHQKEIQSQQPKPSIGQKIIDAQISYMGVTVGDRDYTDLNSWLVISLANEIIKEDSDMVAQSFRDWSDGVALPIPGSFAFFQRKTENNKSAYVQYL